MARVARNGDAPEAAKLTKLKGSGLVSYYFWRREMKNELAKEMTSIIVIVIIAIGSMHLMASAFRYEKPDKTESQVQITAFTAEWCGPCQKIRPILIAIRVRGVIVDIIDIDTREGKELAKKHSVTSVPTFIVRVGTETTRTQDILVVVRIVKENKK